MTFLAKISKSIGVSVLFTLVVTLITSLLGIKTIDFKALIIEYWQFGLGIAVGLVIGGHFKNLLLGIVVAVSVIILLYYFPFNTFSLWSVTI